MMMTAQQIERVRRRVRASIESIERGEYVKCDGPDDLRELAQRVKARGRRFLARKLSVGDGLPDRRGRGAGPRRDF